MRLSVHECFLREKIGRLSDADVSDGLAEYLPEAERVGLLLLMRAALVKLR